MTEGAENGYSFADKLNRLLRTLATENNKPMSANRFVEDFTAKTGMALSKGYLSELRNGVVTAPRIDLVLALSDYFGIKPGYFLDQTDDERNASQLDLIRVMRENEVGHIALRAEGLSPAALKSIAQMIDAAREIEGLPPLEPFDKGE